MRILHAPQNIGGMAAVLARAQAARGHDARSYCPRTSPFKFPADYTLRDDRHMSWARAAVGLARRFDVFHFYFGSSLLDDTLWDVPVLARLGKKLFFYFCGCDLRDEKHTVQTYPVSACAHCFPKTCLLYRDRARAMALRYGRVNFVSTPDLLEFLPGSVLLPQAVDFDLVDALEREGPPPRPPGRFVVAHAPTDRQRKGTPYLLDAVARLQARGYAIELLLVENLGHAEALRRYRQADLAVDQLLVGSYGLLAAELMALGVPTLVYLRPDLLRHYPEPPPLVGADPTNIEQTLAWCYDHREELAPLREAGRRYARAVHHPDVLARRCLEYYQ